MTKQFEFADFIDEFRVGFTVYEKQLGSYNDAGKWVPGGDLAPVNMQGIILPLSNDELKHEANGVYTVKDRKIYTTKPLKLGQKIEYEGDSFTIDSKKPYEAYADV